MNIQHENLNIFIGEDTLKKIKLLGEKVEIKMLAKDILKLEVIDGYDEVIDEKIQRIKNTPITGKNPFKGIGEKYETIYSAKEWAEIFGEND